MADGESPDKCPRCGAPSSAFVEVGDTGEASPQAQHEEGAVQGLDSEIVQGLRNSFTGASTAVGMYLAMARQADREGYPEIASMYTRAASQKAEHAARFAEILGDVANTDTRKNLQVRAGAENEAALDNTALAKRARDLGYDAVYDTANAAAQDAARHGKEFEGALNRYFN